MHPANATKKVKYSAMETCQIFNLTTFAHRLVDTLMTL